MNRSDKKRAQIVDTSRELFWKYGFRRVTVEEICQKANVSKMTFYKHFSNKDELAKYVWTKYYEESMRTYRDFMDSDIPFHEKVEKTIQFKLEKTKDVSEEFIYDLLHSGNDELTAFLNESIAKTMKIIYDDYLKAQKRGDIRKDIKPEFIIYIINHITEMTEDKKLASLYDSTQDMIMELTKFFFYGAMGKSGNSQSDQ